MNIETNLLITLLKLTKEGPVSQEMINKDARIPKQVSTKLLQTLQNSHLVYVHDKIVEVGDLERLEIAVKAIKSGADLERVSDLLQWKEFEAMAAVAYENNGYAVQRNVRFKQGGRRWEIDVVGYRKPLVACIDCKHWHHRLCSSTIDRIVNDQVARVRALIRSLPDPKIKIPTESLNTLEFVPIVLSLIADEPKFHERVPIVSILQLQDFLNHLPTHINSLLCIRMGDLGTSIGRQKKITDEGFSSSEPS